MIKNTCIIIEGVKDKTADKCTTVREKLLLPSYSEQHLQHSRLDEFCLDNGRQSHKLLQASLND